jgi:small subunit ribosomal protein S7
MPRRRTAAKREILPDPKFNNKLVTRFVNSLMEHGKKSTAELIFYGSVDEIAEKLKGEDPINVFKTALDNVKPMVEVKSRRVGGANYQVPVDVRPERRTALAIRWLLIAARERNEKTMQRRLAGELIDAFKKQGAAVKKREDTHRMAEANKAFSHYRW